ncbi:malonate--CoA ligase ACSF3, mitochondrial, partial [Musca vetustissima]|uniref:malonate--CoA ligase ACSF3, mitochondrial n=1 Tax=Musca vetustissima TaxID=27455 RepID=UPI002AB6586B
SGSNSSVGFFFSNDVLTILNLWACWISGQVAIPLKLQWTYENLQQILIESKVQLLITPKHTRELAQNLARSQEIVLITVDYDFAKNQNYSFNFNREIFMADKQVVFEGLLQNNFYNNADAMKIYCMNGKRDNNELPSSTLTHNHINSEMKDIAKVWNMSRCDRVLNILPSFSGSSHISNILFPLVTGSTLQIHHPFDPVKAWSIILGINVAVKERVNVLVAESIIFEYLIMEHEKIFSKDNRMVDYIKDYCTKHIRLMISCGDSLSTATFSKWFEITGHSLFENKHITKCKMKLDKLENVNEKQSNKSIITPGCKFRITNSKNQVLMESCDNPMKYFQQTSGIIIGQLWILSPGQNNFINTGKVVAYENGTVTVLGPSKQIYQ